MADRPGRAAAGTRADEQLRVVGRSFVGADAVQKVQGALDYADDWHLPGMLHGKVIRAQLPSARILSIDVSEALRLPGVRAVLTAKDVPSNEIREEASGFGLQPVAMPVLADDRVRYQGEPVALVAADRPGTAEQAAELIVVEYEELPGVFDPEQALEGDAHRVHPDGNRLVEWRFAVGDVDEAMAGAAHVIEGTYRTHHVDHAYMEPEAGVGWIDPEGVLTLRVSTQVIEHARQLSRIIQVPENRVRVIGTYMGGGFGGKEDMTIEAHLALLVWRTRRPVRMAWSRQESLLARAKRHPFVMRYRTGVTGDGEIVAEDVRIVGDAGAYPMLSPRVLFAAGVTACGPYRVPNARIEAVAASTNNVPASAFRGFGAMQVVLGYESQMDRIAETVGRSRTEVRERNFLRQGDRLPTGEEAETFVAVAECMRTALEVLGPAGAPAATGVRRGIGFACNMQPYGRSRHFADRASCWIGLERDGSLTLRTGITDLGGGQAASLAQIAGEAMGVDPSRISVHIADSALTPLAGGTFATRQLYMSGNAALKAAGELRDRLAPVAADLLGAPSEDLLFADERVSIRSDGERFLSLSELARAAEERGIELQHLGTFHAEITEFDPRTGRGRTFPDYTYGCHAAEVEVDVETGVVRVVRYAACHDVGRIIDPIRVEGQIQGGAVQGIGYALSEELASIDGVSQSSLFADYLIPVSTDVPDIQAIALEVGPGKGPFGARGIGEPPIAPPAAAIANALADAVGVRITDLPITPERVLEALRQAGAPAAES
jgi:xanthine dehydrogenase molybdenum-binding subunit